MAFYPISLPFGGYTFACTPPSSSSLRLRSTFSDTLFSHSTILLRFTAYHTCCVPPAYRDDALFFLPRFTFTSLPAPHVGSFSSTKRRNSKPANFDLYPRDRVSVTTLYVTPLDESRLFRASSVHLF